MTSTRIRALPAAILTAALLLAGTVQAQAPTPQAPAGAVPHEAPAAARPAITIVSLAQPEGPAAGTLEASAGGLGTNLWSATPRAEAEALLERLPVSSTVTPIRALARRLLLTKSPPPAGDARQAFLTVRLRRLLDGGMLADAGQLAATGEVPGDAGYDRARAEALLYAGDAGGACGPATARRNDSAEAFWIRLRAYCYVLAGDEAASQLTIAVLKAQNISSPAFDQLLANLRTHAPKAAPALEAPDALLVSLARQEGLPISLDAGVELGTPGLLMAVRSKASPPAERLEAAERVLRTGALPVDELAALADAQSFSRDQFATEHAQVQQAPFLKGQALLRQAARHAPADVQPALVYEALSSAQTKDLTGIAAALQRDALLRIAPVPADRGIIELFARALMLSGEPDRAAAWIAMLSPSLPNEAPLRARLSATLRLMAPSPAREAEWPAAVAELSQELVTKPADSAYAALVLGVYAALKEPLPPEAEAASNAAMKLNWPGRRPAPALIHRLAEALRSPGSRGAALCLILIAFGPQGASDMAPDAVVRLVRDLEHLGLGQTARDMAVSALLRFVPAVADTPASLAPGSATL